jgi:hypothetical protein
MPTEFNKAAHCQKGHVEQASSAAIPTSVQLRHITHDPRMAPNWMALWLLAELEDQHVLNK